MKISGKSMIVCKVCGTEFFFFFYSHYVCRDIEVTGIQTINRKEEVKQYDAFDCPNCGCQVIAKERKPIKKQ